MAAILVAADLAEWATGLQFDGSSPVSTAQAAAMIRRHQTRFASAAIDRGYSAANVEDATHALYDIGQEFVGLRAAAQCWLAFTRGAGRDFANDLKAEAVALLAELEINPDALAGADALGAADGVANRPRSSKTRTTPHTMSSTLDRIRRTRLI
jgi:LPS sulfotransferase NodH